MSESLPAGDLIQRYLDNVAEPADLHELQRQLTTNPEVADAFIEVAWFDALLQTSAVRQIQVTDLELSIASSLGPVLGHSRQVCDQIDLPDLSAEPEEFGLPSVPGLGILGNAVRCVAQIGMLPYLVFATVMLILGSGAQLVWEWSLSDGQPVAQAILAASSRSQVIEPTFVGRITGMSSCKWAPGSRGTAFYDRVAIGRQFNLDAGLLEITYDSGAKVILQGPVAYEVTGNNRGRLSAGRLTGQVTTDRARGFLIDTPTAHVIDLGTEFGVEVNRQGETTSHVYRGSVRLQAVDAGSQTEAATCVLRENEAARVETGNDRKPAIQPVQAAPDAFARHVPEGMPIDLFNTGAGVNVGDLDPHWQIIRVSNNPGFRPVAATVVQDLVQAAKDQDWVANGQETSHWISLPDAIAPNGVTCTFRTTFEVAGVHLETAGLLGRFIVDDHIRAIRLNGREIPVPEHGYEAAWERSFIAFSIGEGFIEGRNVLEIDVENSNQRDKTKPNQMGLRLELVAAAEGRDRGSGK